MIDAKREGAVGRSLFESDKGQVGPYAPLMFDNSYMHNHLTVTVLAVSQAIWA
jgi:hypothetical protein